MNNDKIIIKLKDGSRIEIENFEIIDFEDKSESEENKNFNDFQKTANSKLNWETFKDEFEEVLIKNNFTDKNGDIDISYSPFNGNVNMSYLKIDGDLDQRNQKIAGKNVE